MKWIFLAIMIFFTGNVMNAATAPSIVISERYPQKIKKISLKEITRLTGRKLSLKEKISFFLLQHRLKKFARRPITEKQSKQATASMILGIASIVLLFTPVGVIAIPAAIIGLILGIISLDGNSNTKGIVGVVTSSVTILLIILAVIVLAALLSTF